MSARRLLNVLLRLYLLASIAVLFLLIGAWSAWREGAFFMKHLRPAFIGAAARLDLDPLPRWQKEERRRAQGPGGVISIDRERAAPGLTLVLVGGSAHLIELDGRIRHTWRLGYEELRNGKELQRERPAEGVYWWRARALPNGDLLVIYDQDHRTPEGLAIARIDRDSRPVWVYHGHVHHDFDIARDGRVYVLGMSIRARPPGRLRGLLGPMLEERLLILSPAGELLRDISIAEAFVGSPYANLVTRTAGVRKYKKGDYLHSNNVDIVDAAIAARFPFVREGQVLLSLRELSALAVLDVERRRIVWARQDEWVQQHDPDFLENGNLLIFDNQGDYARGGLTRVIEYEPRTGAIVWQYAGKDRKSGLRTLWRGDQQRLPNGNTLINDYGRGRVLEVTSEGDVAWELPPNFTFPGEAGGHWKVMRAERYSPSELRFAFNEGEVSPR